MTRCLVLGATGFIGGQIARAAVARGWQVRGLRRQPGAVGAIGDLGMTWVEGDLADCASLVAAMLDCEVVFHCAGAYPHDSRQIEASTRAAVEQMRHVLAAAREAGVRRLVYTSSFTTIGRPTESLSPKPAEAAPMPPIAGVGARTASFRIGTEPSRLADERDFYVPGSANDPYYEAKWAMEVEALRAAGPGLEVVVLCPVAVFGPGDVHLSVSQPLLMTAQGRLPFYLDATFSVVDVRDAAETHVAAAERGRSGERYILCGHNLTMREGLAEVAAVAGARPPFVKLGGPLLKAFLAVGSLIPGSNTAYLRTAPLWRPVDNAKAVRELGLRVRPFAETARDALAWFRERGFLR
ncbi:MAG: NAD-dependent epimerase/dehydratase family protein [Chloroflexi bacterium]|nr:NAD-dependent epimerase/dehydratase family protein [Chloroflexota bacterium]